MKKKSPRKCVCVASRGSLGAARRAFAASSGIPDYTHFVVTPGNRIVSGWEYRDDAVEDQREWARSFPSAKVRVLSRRGLQNQNVDPSDTNNWLTRVTTASDLAGRRRHGR